MITVIDSPCGYGKTSFAINMINDNPTPDMQMAHQDLNNRQKKRLKWKA